MDNKNLLNLRDSIEKLSKDVHIEIFKLLKKENVEFSENKNGVFINLSILDDKIINKLDSYLNYVITQENMINQIESEKNNVVKEYFT